LLATGYCSPCAHIASRQGYDAYACSPGMFDLTTVQPVCLCPANRHRSTRPRPSLSFHTSRHTALVFHMPSLSPCALITHLEKTSVPGRSPSAAAPTPTLPSPRGPTPSRAPLPRRLSNCRPPSTLRSFFAPAPPRRPSPSSARNVAHRRRDTSRFGCHHGRNRMNRSSASAAVCALVANRARYGALRAFLHKSNPTWHTGCRIHRTCGCERHRMVFRGGRGSCPVGSAFRRSGNPSAQAQIR
jgi:hypothetical protein